MPFLRPLPIEILPLALCAVLAGCVTEGSSLPPAFDLTPRGSIQVSAETSGPSVPEDSYRVTVVPGAGVEGSEQSGRLGPNGTVTFSGLRLGTPGRRAVRPSSRRTAPPRSASRSPARDEPPGGARRSRPV